MSIKSVQVICSVVLIAVTSLISVNALRCHQCNSHIEPDCLTVHKVEARQIGPFLKECEGDYGDQIPFCRKIALKIKKPVEEIRVIRTCGWIAHNSSHHRVNKDHCYNADNEDYTQIVCQCYDDGCNSAPKGIKLLDLGTTLVAIGFTLLVPRWF